MTRDRDGAPAGPAPEARDGREAPDGRTRVVLAESGKAVGGTERVVWELATRLPAHRFDVQVWLSDAPGVDELAGALERRQIPVVRLAEVDSRWDWKGMLGTWRRLRQARPALLHVHHVWPAADRYLAAIARASGVPHLVVTEHIVGQSHSAGQRALKRREFDSADVVTAVCGAVADSLVRDYAVPRAHVRVVPNGADLPDEAAELEGARAWRARCGVHSQRPLWVCAARLEEQKGQRVLLEALAALQARGLEFVAVLAGEGSLKAELDARAVTLGLSPRVRFVGQVEQLGPLLAAADVMMLPSLWEGLPLILLEALARSRPVVASAVGGIPEVIEDGVHGKLVPPSDPSALAEALEFLHRHADVGQRLGRAGRRRVEEEFTWDRVVESFETVYDEVLGLASFTPAAAAAGARRGGAR